MSFVIFLFVGVLWNQTAGMDAPELQFELTKAACELDRAQWLQAHEAANERQTPAFRTGYGATPCIMVISQSGTKQT